MAKHDGTVEAGYNGWSNYETWNVALWLDNEQGSYLFWREQAEDAWGNAKADRIFTRKDRAAITLADALKEYHEENTPEVSGTYADLLNAALSEVNWREVALHLLDDDERFNEDAPEATEVAGE